MSVPLRRAREASTDVPMLGRAANFGMRRERGGWLT
jgi:hypothetical protein